MDRKGGQIHEQGDAYMKSTVTKVSIEFSEKEDRKQQGGYGYKTEHKPRNARNTGIKTGREENRARGGEAQRAEAAARHQCRSKQGGKQNLGS